MHRQEPGTPHRPAELEYQVVARSLVLFLPLLGRFELIVKPHAAATTTLYTREHRNNKIGPNGAACIATGLALLTGLQSVDIGSSHSHSSPVCNHILFVPLALAESNRAPPPPRTLQ